MISALPCDLLWPALLRHHSKSCWGQCGRSVSAPRASSPSNSSRMVPSWLRLCMESLEAMLGMWLSDSDIFLAVDWAASFFLFLISFLGQFPRVMVQRKSAATGDLKCAWTFLQSIIFGNFGVWPKMTNPVFRISSNSTSLPDFAS